MSSIPSIPGIPGIPFYTKKEQEQFLNQIHDYEKQSLKLTYAKFPDDKKAINIAFRVLKNHMKNNKNMILYGGTGQSMLLQKISNSLSYYSEDEYPDFDTISIDPKKDGILIVNQIAKELQNNNIDPKNIKLIEAIHFNTYSIKIKTSYSMDKTIADITYCPPNLINHMRYKEQIDNIYIVDPKVIIIDYLRIFIDPLLSSSFRWEKHYQRFNQFIKYYPIMHSSNSQIIKQDNEDNFLNYVIKRNDTHSLPIERFSKIRNIQKIIHSICKDRADTLLITGIDEYNKFIKLSPKNNNIKKLKNPFIELVSINYIKDVEYIIKTLQSKLSSNDVSKNSFLAAAKDASKNSSKDASKDSSKDSSKDAAPDIEIIETYPFFFYRGYGVEIYYHKLLILKVYDNLNYCIPYIKINKKSYVSEHYLIFWFLTQFIFNKYHGRRSLFIDHQLTNKEKFDNIAQINNEFLKLAQNVLFMRRSYYTQNKIGPYDVSPFQDFIIQCYGLPVSQQKLKEKIIPKYQRFQHTPSDTFRDINHFNYPNVTGSVITDKKDKLLIKAVIFKT